MYQNTKNPMATVSLCSVCARQLTGTPPNVDQSWKCSVCFGIMDPEYINGVANAVKAALDSNQYDSQSFVLALNVPVSVMLREAIFAHLRKAGDVENKGSLESVPFKTRMVDAYIGKLKAITGLRPTLNSLLTLTITFANVEFNVADSRFLLKHFGTDFVPNRKLKRYEQLKPLETNFTKVRISNLLSKITSDIASDYNWVSPTEPCTYSFTFERAPLFIASRYCKYSRSLPQSPWTASEEIPKIEGNSVSEKIAAVLKNELKCDSTRFIACGREDVDVRMLGNGRPFVVQCINPHLTQKLTGKNLSGTLKSLEEIINADKDISLGCNLKVVTADEVEALKVDQEEKRKCYTAYCYSTEAIDNDKLSTLSSLTPLEIIQKTPVRVLKRRSLLERKRTIFLMESLKVDDYHFLLRLETQAGTYVKEFVHGDFGRTRPSLAELIGLSCKADVDILELDVEYVDMQWPPS
uniref:tRNA pseudouridine(55) synthase n=1 Tax=Syphacia muris TaxID=451379 RepID=A0A0N5AUG6_9BILA